MALKRTATSYLRLASHPTLRNVCLQCRALHRLNQPALRVPKPTPFVPDPQTFLTLIGRGMSRYAAQIPSWEALFTLSSQQLRESGVEPARARKYLLWWRERFRKGLFGIGGDCTEVENGLAELRVVEVVSTRPSDMVATVNKDAGMRKMVVNTVPHFTIQKAPSLPKEGEDVDGAEDAAIAIAPPPKVDPSQAKPVAGVSLLGTTVITGTGIEAVKGHQGVAKLAVKDGLWEQRRGHKIDGGERRKAEVRSKRRAAERKSR